TNQLYYCGLNEEHRKLVTTEPQEVAIRLYQKKYFNNYDTNDKSERLSDTIIALITSHQNLGPKIYGLFESGQIMAYYQHRVFSSEDERDVQMVTKLAHKLAAIHSLEVPLKLSHNWIADSYDHFFHLSKQRFDLNSMFNEYDLETLKTHDLSEEIQWMKELILATDSPVTFAHNDFSENNIMVTKSNDIVVCDYEYSCRGYRGYDFGSLLLVWRRNACEIRKPHEFPDDHTLRQLIEPYIEESVKLNGNEFLKDKRNSVESMLREVKVFTVGMTDSKEINTDFSSVKWERGQTPDNIKDRCFHLCRDYLGDVWLNVTIDDIEVKRLSGGLTNQLYYCALNEDHRNTDEEVPQE
ncbi:unnamed protein product, partial [Oppiella nova]